MPFCQHCALLPGTRIHKPDLLFFRPRFPQLDTSSEKVALFWNSKDKAVPEKIHRTGFGRRPIEHNFGATGGHRGTANSPRRQRLRTEHYLGGTGADRALTFPPVAMAAD